MKWRRSSDGQSMRFIPAASLVRIQSPLPYMERRRSAFDGVPFLKCFLAAFLVAVMSPRHHRGITAALPRRRRGAPPRRLTVRL